MFTIRRHHTAPPVQEYDRDVLDLALERVAAIAALVAAAWLGMTF